jgi:predicted XRE-type DNA-binding protein
MCKTEASSDHFPWSIRTDTPLLAGRDKAMPFETFDSLFDALADTLAESASMKVRFELMLALQTRIQTWGVAQKTAAARLGITRPRLNNLMRGKLAKFSMDALIDLTAAAGLVVEIRIEDGVGSQGDVAQA